MPGQFGKTVILLLINTVAEFLPISSTAHSILINRFLNRKTSARLPLAISQLAIDLVLCLHFRNIIVRTIKNFFYDPETRLFCYNIVLTSLPFLVVGALLGKTIRKYLYFNNVLATFLILGGVFLIFVEKQLGRMRNNLNEPDSLEKIEPALMHKIGLAQAISILPGVSRLVCTVGSALLLGLTRKMAVDFSYFISIPVGLAGSLFDILGELMTTGMSNYPALIGYFTISMVFALFFVKIMLDFLRSRRLSVFGYYRVLMGAVILLFFRG